MTKKDFIRFATLIREQRAAIFATYPGVGFLVERAAQLEAVKQVAIGMANVFKADNPRFKTETFLDACDLYSEPRETGAAK